MTIGSFGGDRDNFEWPRHDGDFAVLRAYVAPDGSSAEYAAANVPYHPAHPLKVQPAGVGPGDFVMAAGFPGSTQRYDLAAQLEHRAGTLYPYLRDVAKATEAILAEEAVESPEAGAHLGSAREELANGRKYLQGILDNVADTDVLARKRAAEAALDAWIAADPARTARYAPGLAELRAKVAARQAGWRHDAVLGELDDCDLLSVATTAVHLAWERQKPDLDRDEGFRERDVEELAAGFDGLDESLWLPADRRVFEAILGRAATLPEGQRIAALDALASRGPAAVDELFDAPALTHGEARRGLLTKTRKQLEASTDPWVRLAVALEPEIDAQRDADQAFEGALSRLEPVYMAALTALHPGDTYPDANNTLRLTFGHVRGYAPRDAVSFAPQTTVAGMLAKAASPDYTPPTDTFLAWAATSRHSPYVDPRLGDVPVGFLSDLDTTGGNSGSATLNAKGELVGLVFDGNYESMAADWLFDDAVTRTVHVDIRYLLFVLAGEPDGGWIRAELAGS
jgi:hypothetical protein